jgi:hypothetical protein
MSDRSAGVDGPDGTAYINAGPVGQPRVEDAHGLGRSAGIRRSASCAEPDSPINLDISRHLEQLAEAAPNNFVIIEQEDGDLSRGQGNHIRRQRPHRMPHAD